MMEQRKIKSLLFSAFCSLIILVAWMLVVESIKLQMLDLSGLVIGAYYFVPVLLATFIYGVLFNVLFRKKIRYKNNLWFQIITYLFYWLVLVSLWVLAVSHPGDLSDTGFITYFWPEIKRYSVPIIYFGISIPLLVYLFGKRWKTN